MSRRSRASLTVAVALLAGACSSDPRDEAPPLATAAAIAQAPPNAVGASVDRPAPAATTTSTRIKPSPPTPLPTGGLNPKIQPMDPLAPDPHPDDEPEPTPPPQKGTPL